MTRGGFACSGVFLAVLIAVSGCQADWGTYRPNLYFGTRTRSPNSLLTGILWYNPNDPRGFDNVRHDCQVGELEKFGYSAHDGSTYASQHLTDKQNNLALSTMYVESDEFGSGHWTARISGTQLQGQKPQNVSLIFYSYLEGEGELKVSDGSNAKKPSLRKDVHINGEAEGVGAFSIVIPKNNKNTHPEHPAPEGPRTKKVKGLNDLSNAYYLGMKLQKDKAWNVREYVVPPLRNAAGKVISDLKNSKLQGKGAKGKRKGSHYKTTGHVPGDPNEEPPMVSFTNTLQTNPNVMAIQMFFQLPFSIDVIFVSQDGLPEKGSVREAVKALSGTTLDAVVSRRSQNFMSSFDRSFDLSSMHNGDAKLAKELKTFGRAALSNLLGGVGYFYGSSLIARPGTNQNNERENARESPKKGLLTGTPSRPFFPRGFLWDEGFHQLLIGEWSDRMSTDIMSSWFDQMTDDGWIAREQILGREARSKVPEQFQVQNPDYANPPTFFLSLRRLLERAVGHDIDQRPWLGGAMDFDVTVRVQTDAAGEQSVGRDPAVALAFVKENFSRLATWWRWYMRTQKGSKPGSYRWRGKTDDHTLTSGLDDYPRGPTPRSDERHLDLFCWMAMSARLLAQLASAVGANPAEFIDAYGEIVGHLDEHHWNPDQGLYSDYAGLYRRTENGDPVPMFVPNRGYMNLFPLIAGLLAPDSPQLKATLDFLGDEKQILSKFGLTSLSMKDPAFGTRENYWRGPIWININYLVCGALKRWYMKEQGPYQGQATDIYKKIKTRVVQNLFKEYRRTGHFFEQYDPHTGQGKRSNPFNGWSSLVLLMMAEIY